MTSPACTVADGANPAVPTLNGVDVVDDLGTVTIAIADTGGVRFWGLTVASTDDKVAAPALSVNQTTKVATFTKPAGPWALIFQSQVNGGLDINSQENATYTTTFGIYEKANGLYRLAAASEETEGSAAFGWTTKFNDLVRAVASATSGLFTPHTMNGADLSLSDATNALVKATNVNGHTLTLPPSPTAGQSILWCFNDTALLSGNATANGGSNTIIGPNASGTSYVVKATDWGTGSVSGPSIMFVYLGSAWKIS